MKILVFGTTYCGSPAKLALLEQWAEALERIAPDCDHLIVDSQSPCFDTADLPFLSRFGPRLPCPSQPTPLPVGRRTAITFPESIGHLAGGGRDGWGRAFFQGMLCALAGGYDFAVHVGGDLLTRLDLQDICAMMTARGILALGAVTPKWGWLELGLMFFNVEFARRTRLVARYRWPHRQARPAPEVVMGELLGARLFLQVWRGSKDDIALQRYQIQDLHWLTNSTRPGVYDAFMNSGIWPARGDWPPHGPILSQPAGPA
jgi:hypothetical protein